MRPTPCLRSSRSTANDESPRLVHRVKAGETLSSIARKYQTTVDTLRVANSLRTTTLKVGARLFVQASRAVAAQQQQTRQPKTPQRTPAEYCAPASAPANSRIDCAPPVSIASIGAFAFAFI